MHKKPFTLGLIQMRMTADPAANLAHALDMLEQAAKKGAEVVCLPELFTGWYFCQSEDHTVFNTAEPIPGPISEALGKASQAMKV